MSSTNRLWDFFVLWQTRDADTPNVTKHPLIFHEIEKSSVQFTVNLTVAGKNVQD